MYFSKKRHEEGERRAEWRVKTDEDFIVEYKVGKIFRRVGVGYGRDISIHGLRFAAYRNFRKGRRLELTILFPAKFPGPRKIRVAAEVMRNYIPRGAERARVGCRLAHLSDSTKEALRQFMWWLETKPQTR